MKSSALLYSRLNAREGFISGTIIDSSRFAAAQTVLFAGRDAAETHVEDEQSFLSRLLQYLQQQQPFPAMMAGAVNGSVCSSKPANLASSPSHDSVTGTPIKSAQV